jgi:DNA-binding MarR family transcriptional regulator
MKLTRAQIEMLAALHVMQPATVTALLTYIGRHCDTGSDSLQQLVRLGLAEREKWTPPEVEITDAMRRGFEPMPQGKTGKRPYLYTLTPAARAAAFYLHQALQALEETTA